MPAPSTPSSTKAAAVPYQSRAGFTMVEVILALGILGIAIISVLGLIAPTLSEVQHTQDINEGTACIAKMNSLIDSAPFWNSSGTAAGETVWQWIADSHSISPSVFIFYNEIPNGTSGSDTTPVQRVARFNVADNVDNFNSPLPSLFINVKDPTSNRFPLYGDNNNNMADFLAAVNESRVTGPVIAMTLSLSPLAQHFPSSAATAGPFAGINEQNFYVAPAQGVLNGLFSDTAFGTFLADPDGLTSGMPFPEAYLPIYVQVFSLSVANLQTTSGSSAVENQILDGFSTGSRLFTYTTAKLR